MSANISTACLPSERRSTLTGWALTMLSVFWSVWWASVMQRVLEKIPLMVQIDVPVQLQMPSKDVLNVTLHNSWPVPTDWLFAAIAVFISVYTFSLVCLTWQVCTISGMQPSASRVVKPFIFYLLCAVGLLAFTSGLARETAAPDPESVYGFVLTLCWPAVVAATNRG